MKTIELTQIDPLLELIDDPISFIRSKYYATENDRVLRARKEAYSHGFETALKTNKNNVYRRGYNAGRKYKRATK